PDLSESPILLTDKPDRGRVIALNDRAHAAGARAGQTVVQARAAVHDAEILLHDSARSQLVWEDMLDALDAVSPLVDDSCEGLAFLEMRGIVGGAHEWIALVRRTLAPFELPVRVALASNKFVARSAAYASDGSICLPGEEATCVAPLPLELLELDPRTTERLRLLGVKNLGELARLPHGPFVRRFGKPAAAWHERACGVDPTPFIPRAHELHVDATLYGEGAAVQEDQVYFALRILIDRVCTDLLALGKGASLVHVSFESENGDIHLLPVGFAQATADPRPMLDVIRAKMEGLTFTSPVTGLRMQALRLEENGTPATLFAAGQADPQALSVALARLEAALETGAKAAHVQPAHRLEARFAYDRFVPPLHAVPSATTAMCTSPQLRLLSVREINVCTAGNAPAFVGSPPQAVLECAGPWRIDDGWFEAPVTRDEYDVLLEDGALYRIFRQGESWYVRGSYD
ncbi:MAG: hypothetical protein M3Z07_00980, partial [Candidatus Eremiobacteraeota bacterium]|nr:hypothetical protein [Candidatus Eremiobacteraeota bacterium]